jgi:CheY-like chemotaxis protein/HPt (histidine-containing phosphotransfer) domain-containing protein
VDDDAISVEIVALMLDIEGHDVTRASDGETALELLTRQHAPVRPDVLLVDLQMPGISGNELAKKVLAIEGLRPLLLGMSATDAPARKLGGFDGFLLKPLTIESLRQALASDPASARQTARPRTSRAIKSGGSMKSSVLIRNSPGKTGQVFDRAILGKLAGTMPIQSLRELLQVCIDDARMRTGQLRTIAESGKREEIPRIAHQIKGSASMVGASQIARLAAILESGSCKEEDTPRLINDLLDACDTLERMLLGDELTKAIG